VQAWVIQGGRDGGRSVLVAERRARPVPGEREVRIAVRACGVCRTDLHLLDGDLPLRRDPVVPGHEVVGVVDAIGPGCRRLQLGDRVGVAWLAGTCGICTFCRRGRENLCPNSSYTGWDRDGGYADAVVAAEDYVYRLPPNYDDVDAAPLLCAGIIGFRAWRQADVPPGGAVGIYGFGASGHLTAQVALAEGARVHVVTRQEAARRLARELGASSAVAPGQPPPEPLDAAVVFAPAGEVVAEALAALAPAGCAVVAGIHVSTIPPLDYHRHLFGERRLQSVTANTRNDGREFLDFAARHRLQVEAHPYQMAEADVALGDLAAGRLRGAAVLVAEPELGHLELPRS
jgi:propanol-preferring alcohol dehydrogenase